MGDRVGSGKLHRPLWSCNISLTTELFLMPQLDMLSEEGWVWEDSSIGTGLAIRARGPESELQELYNKQRCTLVISILRKWRRADPLGLTSHPA